ncbi:UDP-glucose 6-dehydrogenase [Oopsacas minuta]|uniref:UDP-glucose 6-dehydrogenase n=1 Tax=Oopsacas minuta TaxID=111878 RepID=A0AAV7K1I5_9METZ|nr:UDP-glucose 6-dehydrogenase [Oopsacas minuta]
MVTDIACIGAGYVGVPTCSVIAKHCPDITVTALDIDEERIKNWNAGIMPFYEPGLKELITECKGKNLFFSTDIRAGIQKAELILICVNTPTREYGLGKGGGSDMRYIESAARSIASAAESNKIIIEKSTVPLGTADHILHILKANSKPNIEFIILSNPEFLSEGTAIHNLEKPDRVLIGGPQTPGGLEAIGKLYNIYKHWVPEDRIIGMNAFSSELSKLATNAFLAQRVSSINSISAICENSGADVIEVLLGIGTDSRIGTKYLMPSIGFGGSCFKKDILNLAYICYSLNLTEVAEYWLQVLKMNEYQCKRFASSIIERMFSSVAGKSIGILGFTFKKGTSDTRESASIYISSYLLADHALLHIYDPRAEEERILSDIRKESELADELVSVYTDPYLALKNCHAIALCTEWDEFKSLDYKRIFETMRKPAFVFDGRNILDHKNLEEIGYQVYAIGKNL